MDERIWEAVVRVMRQIDRLGEVPGRCAVGEDRVLERVDAERLLRERQPWWRPQC